MTLALEICMVEGGLKVYVFFSKCLIHYFQSIHNNDIFEVREVQIENIQNKIIYQNSVSETTNI